MKMKMWILLMLMCLSTSVLSQPIEISTPDELQAIGADETSLAGEYILVNDIDLAGYPWNAIFLFAGTLDGNGHVVKNLTTNNQDNRAGGLIGKSLEGSLVKNVGIVDCNITSGWYSAAVVGDCFGDIVNCFAEGGTVTSITGSNVGNIGSFAGLVRASGSVTDCYSTVDVTFGEPGWANQGGFIGHVGGPVANCYYAGIVTVAGDDGLGGGFFGNGEGILTSCYFNVEVGGIAGLDSAGSSTDGGRTTDEMTQEATYVDWDLANVWSIDEGLDYPQLRNFGEQPMMIAVPNGDFETLYKPGTEITGIVAAGGWSMGVGLDCPIDGGTGYEFTDGTTGTSADIAGWIGYDMDGWVAEGGTYDRDITNGNFQGNISLVDGNQFFGANGGGWGNPAGGLITSAASLGTVLGGEYTLSMIVRGPDGAAIPVVLDLLADGVVLAPASSVDPEVTGDWQEVSRTYDAASLAGVLGQDLTIVLGVARGSTGGQTHFDGVLLSYVEGPIAIAVPNGNFETILMPGSDAITADLGDGWTQGVGPNTPMDSGTAAYSDGTTGDAVDIPGWIGADAQGWIDNGGTYDRDTSFPNRQGALAAQIATPDGLYYYLANGGGWGNSAGGLIVSEAPVATVGNGLTYTLSMLATGPDGPAIPVALELLADGVALTPSASVDPELNGDWQEVSRTYDVTSLTEHIGASLTIRLGVNREASGGQTCLDAVLLSYVQESTPESIDVENASFESPDLGPGGTGQWADHVDTWIINAQGNAYLEDGTWQIVAPDGVNTLKMWNGAAIWQQIGSVRPNTDYDISLFVGRGYDTGGVQVELWAGGDPGALPASFGIIGDTVGATLIGGASLTPTVEVGQNELMSLSLNTGADFGSEDALWIRIEALGEAAWVDNVTVAVW